MKIVDRGFWVLLETVKYVILTHGILGFRLRGGRRKYLVFLYLLVGIPVLYYLKADGLFYQTIWGILLIWSLYEGSWSKKCQAFLLEYVLIVAMELFVRSIYMVVWDSELSENTYLLRCRNEVTAIGIWLVVACCMKKYRIAVKRGFEELSGKFFALLFMLLFGTVTAVTLAWGMIQNEFLDKGRQLVFTFYISVMLFTIIILVVFIWVLQKKNELEIENRMTKECYDYQKNYYEEVIKKDEEMRSFRHDIRNHMNAISVLCEKENLEQVRNYIGELQESFEEISVCKTGNEIADYFINQTIKEVQADGNFEYSIAGRFPVDMSVSESDFCVLFGNAMDNAKEALLKCEGERKLLIEIKNYKKRLFLTIANSTDEKIVDFKTSKEDKKNHGYGIKNMEHVAEKYEGKVEAKYLEGMFVLEIEL